jgi:hypothetical protein
MWFLLFFTENLCSYKIDGGTDGLGTTTTPRRCFRPLERTEQASQDRVGDDRWTNEEIGGTRVDSLHPDRVAADPLTTGT